MTPTSVWFPFVIISFVFGGRRQLGCEANCRCSTVIDRYTGVILPRDRIIDLIPEYWRGGGNVSFFSMGNNLGLSQGDHNGEVTGLAR